MTPAALDRKNKTNKKKLTVGPLATGEQCGLVFIFISIKSDLWGKKQKTKYILSYRTMAVFLD